MNDHELLVKVIDFINRESEGINWDFKRTISDEAEIIKDILAFSNSDYTDDSYIIVGVSEPKRNAGAKKVSLSQEDRLRLNTADKYLYIPEKWNMHGLDSDSISNMDQFSARITEIISKDMLISQPKCEYRKLKINETLWLYIIIVKRIPGVFISKKDLTSKHDKEKIVVKQSVLYVRVSDVTIGADCNVASATEYIRVWKNYFDWISTKKIDGGDINE